VVLGFKFLSLGSSFLESLLGKDNLHFLSPYLSFFVIFIPAIFLFRKVSAMLRKAVRLTFLGVLDGVLGAVLGGITAMFGVSLLIWIAAKIGLEFPENTMVESQFYPYVKDFAPDIISKISDLLPGGNWLEYLKDLKDKISD
jgi:membrane protein required for colicin V production